MTKSPSFRDLVDRTRRRRVAKTEAPMTYCEVARKARISRAMLYFLLAGARRPSPHVTARLARVLEVSDQAVLRSLEVTALGG